MCIRKHRFITDVKYHYRKERLKHNDRVIEEMRRLALNAEAFAVTACQLVEREKRKKEEMYGTFWLMFSVVICVFGNSFLYGYNIGVINSPAQVIEKFYGQVYHARHGLEAGYDTNNLKHILDVSEPNNKTILTVVGNKNDTFAVSAKDNENVTVVDPSIAQYDDNYLDLMWSITVAIFVLFGMIGAFMSGRIADYFGRKQGMIVTSTLMFIAAIFGVIPMIANSPECLVISRAFAGLHSGINASLVLLYLTEISPKKIRGAIATCHQLFITIGILCSTVVGLPKVAGGWDLWPVLFAFNALPSFVCLVLMPLCPESPHFLLIKKNDEDGAKKAFKKLRGYNDVDDEMEEIRTEARKASSVQQFTLKQLLTTPELKLYVAITVVVQVAQQWSGINAVMSYSSFIFDQARVPSDYIPYAVLGQGAINMLATIVAVPLLEKLGRRPLLLGSMCGMALSFVVLTICLSLLERTGNEEEWSILTALSVAALLTYVAGFAFGLGPIPCIVVMEIFPQESRTAAIKLSSAVSWFGSFLLVLVFRFLQKGLGPYTYLIFISVLVGSVIFVFIYVPETKKRSSGDIAETRVLGSSQEKAPFDAMELKSINNEV